MLIKEVVKEVGISVHSIRFYEEVGLISINRFPDSSYRDFSQTDIEKLKEIKLFRSLGITIEEIRRFYQKEISLAELMDHQLYELHALKEDMKLKEALCDDIKQSKAPLISYTVDKYDQLMEHKSTHLPYKEAGSLLAQWGEEGKENSKRGLYINILLFPILFVFVNFVINFIFAIPQLEETGKFRTDGSIPAVIISIIITFILVYFTYNAETKFPNELYKFCEKGIYYIDKDTMKSAHKVRRASLLGKMEDGFDFVGYNDIKTFKVWYHEIGKTPVNGQYVYAVDFRIFTKWDEMIRLDTGILGTSDEKVRITAEILKAHAEKTLDPFQILDHLSLDREAFYKYIDNIHYKRIYKRLGKEHRK